LALCRCACHKTSSPREKISRAERTLILVGLVHLDNVTLQWREWVGWSGTTSGTPGQGVARDPKHKTDAHQQDQSRLANCPPGFIFVKVEKKVIDHPGGRKEITHVDKRGKCAICSTNTKFYCTLCKRFYCMVDRLDKVGDLTDDNSAIVDFLGGGRPRPLLTTKTVNKKKGIQEEHFFRNSCYHIRHRKGLEKIMKSRKEEVHVVGLEQGGASMVSSYGHDDRS
jgi:hypothetical protein